MHTTIRTALALGILGLASTPTWADDQDQDRDQDQDQDQDQLQTMDQIREHTRDRLSEEQTTWAMEQLRERLRKQDGVRKTAMKRAEPEMQRWLRRGGDAEQLRSTVRTAWDNGCEGDCMREMVRTQNQAHAWGMSEKQAGDLVRNTLQERIRERDRAGGTWTDAELADQVHEHAQMQLQVWERQQDQERLQERLREQERQHQRDMERMMQQQGGGGQRGAGHGGT